jgi:hypothetical protein
MFWLKSGTGIDDPYSSLRAISQVLHCELRIADHRAAGAL